MSNESEETRGGFHFGNVGRDVTMKAGGDIVGGNKETTTTTIQTGFKSEEQKQEFQKQLDALREALREIKGVVTQFRRRFSQRSAPASGEPIWIV